MRTRRLLLPLALAVVALTAAAGPASAKDWSADAQGQCATPRQAVVQLLYWLQKDTHDPVRAALCMDVTGLADAATAGPERARQLKTVLDARGLYVDIESLPADPAFHDDKGVERYVLAPGPVDAEIVRRDGRWLFSAATVARVPDLYRDTVPRVVTGLVDRLPAWFHGTVLGIKIWKVFGILALILVAFTLQKITVFLIGGYLHRIAGRLRWVDTGLKRADRPIGGLVMAAVFRVGLPSLQFPVRVAQVAMLATQVLAVCSAAWLGYRVIDVIADWLASKAAKTETKLDDQLVPLLRKSLKLFVAVMGGIFVLQNLNIDVASLLTGLGLGGLAFALAAKDAVANFFGSIMIFADKPFQIGDWVIIQGVEGNVEEVGLRTLRIRTFYNSLVTIPNGTVMNTVIDNMGARRYRRYKTLLNLTYDTPPEKVQAFLEGLRAVVQALPGMRKDFYMVEFHQFGAHSLDVLLYCFMDSPDWATELRTRTHLNLEILRLARELGVSFAFPTQTLHVESLPPPATAAPRAPEPPDPARLAETIRAFGPGGRLARPCGVQLTDGYDPARPVLRGEDA